MDVAFGAAGAGNRRGASRAEREVGGVLGSAVVVGDGLHQLQV